MNNPIEALNLRFLKQLVATPRGRAWLYAVLADVEGSDESRIFEALEGATDDLDLKRMMRRHAADELGHAALLETLARETGVPRMQIPESLNALRRVDGLLGVLSATISTPTDAMRAYALLQVLEERVSGQYALYVEALREVDPAASAVLDGIRADEVRHIQYCQAITRRFAPSAELLEATLVHFRAVEAWAFAQNSADGMRHLLASGALDQPSPVRMGWFTASALAAAVVCKPGTGPIAAFQTSQTREPHQARRRALLAEHPEVRQFFGYDRRTIAVTVGVVAAQLAIAWAVGKLALPMVAVVVAAYAGGAFLSHWLGMTIHETAHNLAARTRLANRALAWLANAPMVVPIAEAFHRYHLEHHAFLGVVGKDSDLPLPIEVRNVRGTACKAAWLLFYPFVYFVRGAVYARKSSRAEQLNAVFVLALNVVLWKAFGPMAVLYLGLSTYFGHGPHPVAAHFLHEHYLFEAPQETYSYYGPLNWVTFNVGYHVEHHDFMNIPGWKLPAYRALVSGASEPLVSHHSWAGLLLEFVVRPDLGAASRLVRTFDVRRAGQRISSAAASPSTPMA